MSGSHDHSLKTHIAVLKGFSTIHCTEAANLIPRTDVWAVLTNGLGSPWLCVPSSPLLSSLSLSLSLPLPAALQLYPGSNNSTFLTLTLTLTLTLSGVLALPGGNDLCSLWSQRRFDPCDRDRCPPRTQCKNPKLTLTLSGLILFTLIYFR